MRLMTALGHERHGRRFRDPSADPRLPNTAVQLTRRAISAAIVL